MCEWECVNTHLVLILYLCIPVQTELHRSVSHITVTTSSPVLCLYDLNYLQRSLFGQLIHFYLTVLTVLS